MAPVAEHISDLGTWVEDARKTVLSNLSLALVAVNEWSTQHPYIAAGGLLLVLANPGLVLVPLRLLIKTVVYLICLPLRLALLPFKLLAKLILWLMGLRADGIERDSFASYYQSHRYRGYIPPRSTFSQLQSYGATDLYLYDEFEDPISAIHEEGPGQVCVRWVALIGAVFILGRTWGFWGIGSIA